MPKLRPLRKQEEIEKVPSDQPVMIDVSEEDAAAPDKTAAPENPDVTSVSSVSAPPPQHQQPPAQRQAAEPPEQSDLQKRLDEANRAQQLANQRAATAEQQLADERRRGAERDQELVRTRTEAEERQYNSVVNGLSAAEAEADAAAQAYQVALEAGDHKAATEAQRRLSRAEARALQYSDAKTDLDARREAAKTAPPPQRQQQQQPSIETYIDGMQGVGAEGKAWLKKHPDAITNAAKNARLQAAHFDALDAGHGMESPAYFEFIETRLGYRQPPPQHRDDEHDDPPQHRSPIVSAPPSRDVPSPSSGRQSATRITLTPEQREAARISGVTEIEYARNLLRLNEEKARGNYSQAR